MLHWWKKWTQTDQKQLDSLKRDFRDVVERLEWVESRVNNQLEEIRRVDASIRTRLRRAEKTEEQPEEEEQFALELNQEPTEQDRLLMARRAIRERKGA